MAIETDIAIDISGNIYYTGAVHGASGAGYYTVIQLHRFLQDLADDASASGDDLIDITSDTPSDRSTDNIITIKTGYTLDDLNGSATEEITQHLYDGSIIEEADGTIYDGLVVIAAEGMDLQILQDGAVVADDFWNSIPFGETVYGLNRDVANGISHRFMIKVNAAGTEIDGRRLQGITREFGSTYSEFKINGTSNGNNVLALTYASDLNNATAKATVATWTGITNTEGYTLLDISGDTVDEPYYSEWNRDTYTINQFYERMKWLTECASGSTDAAAAGTLYGNDGNLFRGITHQIDGTQAGGTFSAVEDVTWTNGTGIMVAIDDTGSATAMWIQVLTGIAPSSGTITGATSSATFTASATTEKTIAVPFCGASTGSALIGAYGFGMEVLDTGASDLFTDLDDNTNQPPNNVTFTVFGIVSTEDRVLVGPEDGASGLREDQMAVQTAEAITVTAGSVSSATSGAGTVVMADGTETIGTSTPSAKDTPTAGQIRVVDSNGVYQIISYTGRTFAANEITFTGCTGTGTWSAIATANAFQSYIDELATGTDADYTAVYDSSRTLFVRVRDGGTAGDNEGIKTFETTGTLGSAGGSTTAIRTTDV